MLCSRGTYNLTYPVEKMYDNYYNLTTTKVINTEHVITNPLNVKELSVGTQHCRMIFIII